MPSPEMPLTPPTIPVERAMPPTGDVGLGGTEPVADRDSDRGGNRRGRKIVAALAVGTVIAVSINSCSGDDAPKSEKVSASEDASKKTPEQIADDCKKPSDTDAFIFNKENGKPIVGLENGKEYSPLGIVSAVAANICDEIEATKYMSELHPLVAFGNSAANVDPSKPVFDQIDADPKLRNEVTKNLLDLLSTGERDTVVLGEQPEAAEQLFTIRFNGDTNDTYAQAISAEEAKGLVVVEFTQNEGDAELNRVGVSKFLVLGTAGKDGQVVVNENSGSIVTTVAGLDGCIVLQPTPAQTSETTLPQSSGAEQAENSGSDSDAEGTEGTGGGSETEDGQDGECSGDCDGGDGEDGGDGCDGGCDHATTTAPPTTKPPVTAPPTTKPPVTAPPTTQPPKPPVDGCDPVFEKC